MAFSQKIQATVNSLGCYASTECQVIMSDKVPNMHYVSTKIQQTRNQ